MTRREKRRLQEEAARQQRQAQADAKICRKMMVLLPAGSALAGVGIGVFLLFFTAFGVLTAASVLQTALYPALAASLLFTLVYGVCFAIAHRVAAARPLKKKLARLSTAASLAAALLTMVACMVFDVF